MEIVAGIIFLMLFGICVNLIRDVVTNKTMQIMTLMMVIFLLIQGIIQNWVGLLLSDQLDGELATSFLGFIILILFPIQLVARGTPAARGLGLMLLFVVVLALSQARFPINF